MARIALLFSGLSRQWANCVQSQLQLFKNHQVDVFFHFWDTTDDAEKRQILNAYQPKAYMFERQVDFSPFEKFIPQLDNINVSSRMMSQYFGWRAVATIFNQYRQATGTHYDFAVRLRADVMYFNSLDEVIPQLTSDGLFLSTFNNFDLVNDMFALGGVEPILYYMSLFDHVLLYAQHIIFNSEHLLIHHLKSTPKPIRLTLAEFKMLVVRPHMVGMSIEECLMEHPGSSKWKDPEVVAAHKEFHERLRGEQGIAHVEQFAKHWIADIEAKKAAKLAAPPPASPAAPPAPKSADEPPKS